MHVRELAIHPVKSTRAQLVDEAHVEPWGLADDRRWMVVDADGWFLTARITPALLSVTAQVNGPGRLTLHGPHAAPVTVDATGTGARLQVRVWTSDVLATHTASEADGWLSALLDRDVRLVWLDDPTRRPTNPRRSTPGDRVSFADGYPLLLATTASARQLDDWVAEAAVERGETPPEPLSIRRFRPNVVVEHDEPFAEDSWQRIQMGPVAFRVAKICDRCVLTTIDPETLERGKEPIRTLAAHRRWDGKVWFGLSLIPDGTGPVRVGDEVRVLSD